LAKWNTRLLTQTLGEEESADYLLTAIADPMMQEVSLHDMGADVDLETLVLGLEPRRKAPLAAAGKKPQRLKPQRFNEGDAYHSEILLTSNLDCAERQGELCSPRKGIAICSDCRSRIVVTRPG
jgi:hypothetical protein